jgi:dTMP kinase
MRLKPLTLYSSKNLPGLNIDDLTGWLFVIEGPDGSGRSTYIRILTDWLSAKGYATINVGLRRSTLVSAEIEKAKQGHTLDERTFTLFYITDFFDQLENIVIPNLKAGYVILADRYIYTLIARGAVRGLSSKWIEDICEISIVPDIVFYLNVNQTILIERNLLKHTTFDFWESGMDMELSVDIFQSFKKYQSLIKREFKKMDKKYNFVNINANRSLNVVCNELKRYIENCLDNNINKK